MGLKFNPFTSNLDWVSPSLWSESSNILSPATNGDGVLIDVPTASRSALTLQTTDDDATNNTFNIKNSSGDIEGYFNTGGYTSPGTGYDSIFGIEKTVSGGNFNGLNVYLNTTTANQIIPLYFKAEATHTTGTAGNITGVLGNVDLNGAGAITFAAGLDGSVLTRAGSGNITSGIGLNSTLLTLGGDITNGYGVRTVAVSAGGSINTYYGYHAASFPASTTNTYGLYVANGTGTHVGAYIDIGTATGKGMVVKANASQTANLTEWQDSSATVKGGFKLSAANKGQLFVNTTGLVSPTLDIVNFIGGITRMIPAGNDASIGSLTNTAFLMTDSTTAYSFYANINSNEVLWKTNNATKPISFGVFDKINLKLDGNGTATFGAASDNIKAIFKAHSTQTANLTEWQNSSGTRKTNITASGEFNTTNNVYYRAEDIGGTSRSLFGINSSDDIIFGSGSVTGDIEMFTGSGTPQLTITNSTGYVTIASRAQINRTGTPGAMLHMIADSASTIGQKIKLAVSQTANAFEITNNSNVNLFSIDGVGRVLSDFDFTTSATASDVRAYQIDVDVTSDNATANRNPRALFAQITTAGSTNFGGTSEVIGLQGQVSHEANITVNSMSGLLGRIVTNGTPGTVSEGIGLQGGFQASVSATITSAIGVLSRSKVNSAKTMTSTNYYHFKNALTEDGTFSFTNEYGLYLEDINNGSSSNYAIFTNSGLVEFNDALTIDGSRDTAQLTIDGHSSQTDDLSRWRNGSGTVLTSISKDGYIGIGASNSSYPFYLKNSTGSGATPQATADLFVIDSNTSDGLSFLAPATSVNRFYFGYPSNTDYHGLIAYGPSHSTNAGEFKIRQGGVDRITIKSGFTGFIETNPQGIVHIQANGNNRKLVLGQGTSQTVYMMENRTNGGSLLSGFDGNADLVLRNYTDGTRPTAGTAGRVIFNTTDGNLNIDDGTNWILPDGTVT